MSVNLSPVGGVAAQFFDNDGNVLSGGKIYTYVAGTSTPTPTYTTAAGNIAHSNPIVLDSGGRVPTGEIWLTDGVLYKFVLKDSGDALIATYDNISGINSNAVAYTNQQEIITATAGQTVFDLTITYAPGTNSLSVFVDGVNQYGPGAQYAYTETDGNTVTFNSGLHVGAEVKFTTTQQQGAGAVDASQVSYDPPFTGSVPTNVEAKLAQTISVMDFGATGDGVTDDTTAIQAALTAGGGNAVYFPAGNYKITSSVSIPNNTYVYGDGEASRLFADGTVGALLRGTWPCEFVTVDNLCIDGGKVDGTGDIVVCFYTSAPIATPNTKNQNMTIRNCVIKNASAGIGIENGKYINVHDNTIYAMYYQQPGSPSAGNYGYGIVLNGCTRSQVMGNIIGRSGGLIQRHAIYLPVFRDQDISPTVTNFCEEIKIIGNTCHVDEAIDPYSSCVEAWNYFDFVISDNILIGGQRGINSSPQYINGSRVLIANNIIKDNYVCIRNGPDSFGNTTYFEEYTITGNQLMPLTTAAHQCVRVQGIKNIIFTNNYCRGNASSTLAFGYRDNEVVPQNIVADSILVGNNRIKGFLQGYSIQYAESFIDTGTTFSNFTSPSTPYPYQCSNVTYREMYPTFAPYVELYQYSGTEWIGAKYYSVALQKNLNYTSSGWYDDTGNLSYGTTAQRPTNLQYGFQYYDTTIAAVIKWNGYCYFTTQQPPPPNYGTKAALNTFASSYPNALLAYGIPSWNTDTSKPVFWNDLTNVWVYADGTTI